MEIHRAIGAAAINSTLFPRVGDSGWQLECVRLHLSAVGGAGTFTVTRDAAGGSEHDTVEFSQDMTAAADVVWTPDPPLKFVKDDKVVFAFANANTRTYGIEAIWSSL